MNKLPLNIFCVVVISLLTIHSSTAQLLVDSSLTEFRKNIVRINPTPTAIVGSSSIAIGYERVIKPHQSVSLNIGRIKFEEFINLGLSQYGIDKNLNSGGYSIAIDYRRYFKKRNKGLAPDGLYWGPFLTYYRYKHELSLSYTDPVNVTTSEVILSADFHVRHIGIELGYQFIIAKRLAIDLIFIGPSWGKYIAEFELTGSLDVDKEAELYQAVYTVISDRIPGLAALIDDRKVTQTGRRIHVPTYIQDISPHAASIFYALRSHQELVFISQQLALPLTEINRLSQLIINTLTRRNRLYLLDPPVSQSLNSGSDEEQVGTADQMDIPYLDEPIEDQLEKDNINSAWKKLDVIEQFVLESLVIDEQDALSV